MNEKVMEFQLKMTDQKSHHKCRTDTCDGIFPSTLWNDFHWRCDNCNAVVTPSHYWDEEERHYESCPDWPMHDHFSDDFYLPVKYIEFCWHCMEVTFQVVKGPCDDAGTSIWCTECMKKVKDFVMPWDE